MFDIFSTEKIPDIFVPYYRTAGPGAARTGDA